MGRSDTLTQPNGMHKKRGAERLPLENIMNKKLTEKQRQYRNPHIKRDTIRISCTVDRLSWLKLLNLIESRKIQAESGSEFVRDVINSVTNFFDK